MSSFSPVDNLMFGDMEHNFLTLSIGILVALEMALPDRNF